MRSTAGYSVCGSWVWLAAGFGLLFFFVSRLYPSGTAVGDFRRRIDGFAQDSTTAQGSCTRGC
jgi:hypothetical protein